MQRPAAPRGGTAAGMQRPRSERKGVQAGQGDKTEVLRQPHSDVRTAVSVELLCERMRILPVSRQKQDHIAQETDPRRYKARGHSLAGHGAQTSGHRGRRRPAAQPAGVYTRIYRHHIWHTPQKRSHKAILFQETYHKANYELLHPRGPKSDYAWHTEAMDRAMQGGIDDVGIGVLFGLNTYKYDFTGLLMHAEHLEAVYGVGPHTISVPRICSADDIDKENFENAISDEIFKKIVAVIRISVPYTGIIVSTRESQKSREEVLEIGVSQISGGSRTTVGGYTEELAHDNSAQFDVSDHRTLDEIVHWLLKLGYIPSFCTACYRAGRTGDRFMSLVKTGQIANCCAPNALMTLKEYGEDYASPDTKRLIDEMIAREIPMIPNEAIRRKAADNIDSIVKGERDFRF